MPMYQHRYSGTLPAGDQFVFSWHAVSLRSLEDAQAAAVAWLDVFWTQGDGFATKCTSGVTVTKVSTGLVLVATGQQQALAEDVIGQPGTAAGSSLPQEVALVVSLRTALANRRGRGRFYLPPLAASFTTTTGMVPTATIGHLNEQLTAAWDAYNTLVDFPVVYSRVNRATERITSFDIGNVYDIQTRRDNKVEQARFTAPMP